MILACYIVVKIIIGKICTSLYHQYTLIRHAFMPYTFNTSSKVGTAGKMEGDLT